MKSLVQGNTITYLSSSKIMKISFVHHFNTCVYNLFI